MRHEDRTEQRDFPPMPRFLTSFAFVATFALASSASAEVLDKLEFPWEPDHYVSMLIVLVCAGVLAASVRKHVRLAGLIVAILWAVLSLWADPWFTRDIGDALRAELTAEQSAQWLRTIFVQALLPLGVTVVVFLWRTITTAVAQPVPR